jgi:hypothetical protein
MNQPKIGNQNIDRPNGDARWETEAGLYHHVTEDEAYLSASGLKIVSNTQGIFFGYDNSVFLFCYSHFDLQYHKQI